MPASHAPLLRGAATVVLGLLLALAPPAAGFGGPAVPDPVGVWPLSPRPDVVHAFDPPGSPYGAGHRGVDLAGRPGRPVRAALDGTVSFAGSIAGRGVVVVDHGATRTTYEPVRASVSVGDALSAGDRLGTLELVGSHCFPRACLHWGWIRNADDVYLDPLRLVGGAPVRLLPLWRDAPAGSPGPATPYAGVLTPGDVLVGRPAAAVRW